MTPFPGSAALADRLSRAIQAAENAGRFIADIRHSGELGIDSKGEGNFVTAADLGAERIVLEMLKDHFPEDAVLSEEANPSFPKPGHGKGQLWIIDPLDGTTNFLYGQPQVGVSVAFAVGGEVQLGVVHAPFLGETFHATRGGGAFLNGKPIRVRDTARLREALVATGFPYERNAIEVVLRQATDVVRHCRDLRRLGAASLDLAFVACGRLDAYYETVMPWDMAAGALIAREAGARVGHILPQDRDSAVPLELEGANLLVACPRVFDDLKALLAADTDDRPKKPRAGFV